MIRKNSLCIALLSMLILRICVICPAAEKALTPLYLLELSSIGLPTAEKEKDGRKINALRVFDGKLYLGHGDAVVNTGPTDVMYYNFETEEFTTEFTVDDEAMSVERNAPRWIRMLRKYGYISA